MNDLSQVSNENKLLNEEELKKVYIEYKAILYNYIYARVQNHSDAEDIFSKTFYKFFNYAEKKIIDLKTVKSFLFTIASNTITDFFRRLKIIKFISLDKYNDEDNKTNLYNFYIDNKATNQLDIVINKEILERINLIVESLPNLQKEAFYLRFIEGFSFAEISSIQNSTLSTALSRVRYSIEKIKKVLKKEKYI